VHVPLAAVGSNLADHLYVPLSMRATAEVSPGVGDQRADAVQYLRTRSGRLASNLAEALLFFRTAADLPAPDIELVWMPVPSFAGEGGHGLTLATVLLQPASRGRITLASADPAAAPLIDPGYLSDVDDLATLTAGVRGAQHILAQDALAPWLAGPLLDGALDGDAAAIAGYARAHADTLYHPAGTCRMGGDQESVLDLEFRVRGVTGLRVVDASAMPALPRGHTHAPTVMLAERAAELIVSRGA
jgi:choline dehydrogenase